MASLVARIVKSLNTGDLKRGFSLIELMIVVAVISILAGVATTSIGNFYRIYKYKEYSYALESAVKWAKLTAMQRSINTGICRQGSNSVSIVKMVSRNSDLCSGDILRTLPISHSDNFVSYSGNGFSFDPKGFSFVTGNICISDGHKHLNVTVGKFGTINVKQNSGGCP